MGLRDDARNSLWLAKLKEQREAEESDPETQKNTTLNQLNYHSTHYQNDQHTDAAFAPNIYQPNFSSPYVQQPPPGTADGGYDPHSNEAAYAAEEGAHKVPILQPAPARHSFKNSDASDAPLRPSSMKPGPLRGFGGQQGDVPPTPRSVTFSYQPPTPGVQSSGFPKPLGH
jgi:hypothetical protein